MEERTSISSDYRAPGPRPHQHAPCQPVRSPLSRPGLPDGTTCPSHGPKPQIHPEQRTGADTKEYTPVKHIPTRATPRSAPNSKETPQKGHTNSIRTHQVWFFFFKALAKEERIHTPIPLLCVSKVYVRATCRRTQSHTPLTTEVTASVEPELASLRTQAQNTAHHPRSIL